ncbi:MAG: threonine--tRNA ligase, partial [Halarcobacter sp.]
MEPIGILKEGQIFDLQTAEALNLSGDEIKADNSPESLEILRHSCAHLMAQAIKELYPDAKFFVGPVVKEGFYYDFKTEEKISEEDLPKIEKKMKELANAKLPIERYEASREEIQAKFANDELKQAVLSNITDDTLTLYKQGEFEDLCRGPHVPNTRMIRSFKLTRVAGAYLGGDEENEMITR